MLTLVFCELVVTEESDLSHDAKARDNRTSMKALMIGSNILCKHLQNMPLPIGTFLKP